MDSKQFIQAIEEIGEQKGIERDQIMDTVKHAVAAAYKKEKDLKGFNIEVDFDPQQGLTGVHEVKEVVPDEIKDDPEEYFNPKKQLLLSEAKKIKKDVKVEDEIKNKLEPIENFGRIATQTAKQVIIQKIKETERDAIYEEFKEKEGEIISGIVQRAEGQTVFFDLGKTNGVLTGREQIRGEDYRSGDRFRLYIIKVEQRSKGPYILLSRARSEMLRKLFELEVPEISEGSVEIKAIAREPGSRSKVAVVSHEEGVDPIGACVGQKGARITTIINELSRENIDIVKWSEDLAKFIAQALAPAKVLNVKLSDDGRRADVQVESDQLSLAIGKKGQNVRLAAKLTGVKIDIQGPEEESVVASGEPEEEPATAEAQKKKEAQKDEKAAATENTEGSKKAEEKVDESDDDNDDNKGDS